MSCSHGLLSTSHVLLWGTYPGPVGLPAETLNLESPETQNNKQLYLAGATTTRQSSPKLWTTDFPGSFQRVRWRFQGPRQWEGRAQGALPSAVGASESFKTDLRGSLGRRLYLESQAAQNNGPLYPTVAHSLLTVASNYRPLAFQVRSSGGL